MIANSSWADLIEYASFAGADHIAKRLRFEFPNRIVMSVICFAPQVVARMEVGVAKNFEVAVLIGGKIVGDVVGHITSSEACRICREVKDWPNDLTTAEIDQRLQDIADVVYKQRN